MAKTLTGLQEIVLMGTAKENPLPTLRTDFNHRNNIRFVSSAFHFPARGFLSDASHRARHQEQTNPVSEIQLVQAVSGGSRRDFSFLPTLIATGHEQGPGSGWTWEYPEFVQ